MEEGGRMALQLYAGMYLISFIGEGGQQSQPSTPKLCLEIKETD